MVRGFGGEVDVKRQELCLENVLKNDEESLESSSKKPFGSIWRSVSVLAGHGGHVPLAPPGFRKRPEGAGHVSA